MLKIGIIVGSTRPGRVSIQVAQTLKEWADKRGDAEYEIVDIKDYHLPLYDEHKQASQNPERIFDAPEAKPWSEKIDSLDGFVFVCPEYNRGLPSALKNAIDYLYYEFNNKAAGIVSYGSAGGVRSAEALWIIMGELQVAMVRTHVVMSLFTDFKDFKEFNPNPIHEKSFNRQLDQILAWSDALNHLRKK